MKSLLILQNNLSFLFILTVTGVLLTGCGPTEGQRLLQEGASPAYAQGYDDGCSSGKKAGGNMFSQFHKNVHQYQGNGDYSQGWNDGHEECRSEQISSMRQQELAIEQQRAMDEHRWTEQQEDRDMARDAMPDLSPQQIHDLQTLGR